MLACHRHSMMEHRTGPGCYPELFFTRHFSLSLDPLGLGLHLGGIDLGCLVAQQRCRDCGVHVLISQTAPAKAALDGSQGMKHRFAQGAAVWQQLWQHAWVGAHDAFMQALCKPCNQAAACVKYRHSANDLAGFVVQACQYSHLPPL